MNQNLKNLFELFQSQQVENVKIAIQLIKSDIFTNHEKNVFWRRVFMDKTLLKTECSVFMDVVFFVFHYDGKVKYAYKNNDIEKVKRLIKTRTILYMKEKVKIDEEIIILLISEAKKFFYKEEIQKEIEYFVRKLHIKIQNENKRRKQEHGGFESWRGENINDLINIKDLARMISEKVTYEGACCFYEKIKTEQNKEEINKLLESIFPYDFGGGYSEACNEAILFDTLLSKRIEVLAQSKMKKIHQSLSGYIKPHIEKTKKEKYHNTHKKIRITIRVGSGGLIRFWEMLKIRVPRKKHERTYKKEEKGKESVFVQKDNIYIDFTVKELLGVSIKDNCITIEAESKKRYILHQNPKSGIFEFIEEKN